MLTLRSAETRGKLESMGTSTNPGAHVLSKLRLSDRAVVGQSEISAAKRLHLGFRSREVVYKDEDVEVTFLTHDSNPQGPHTLEFTRRGRQFPGTVSIHLGQYVAIGEFTPYPPDNPMRVGGELSVRRVIICEYEDSDGASNQAEPSPETTLVA